MTAVSPPPQVELLLAEDNPGDVMLFRQALRQWRTPHHLHVVANGELALSFLHRRDPFADAPRPSLILLDQNMPGKSGREVLREVKSDAALHDVPVLMFTSSRSSPEVRAAYDLCANGYLHKPLELDEFFKVVGALERFWCGTAVLLDSAAPLSTAEARRALQPAESRSRPVSLSFLRAELELARNFVRNSLRFRPHDPEAARQEQEHARRAVSHVEHFLGRLPQLDSPIRAQLEAGITALRPHL